MNTNNRYFIAVACALVILFAACKKDAQKTTSCTSTLYGYNVPHSGIYDTVATRTNGIVNPTTAAISSIGSFSASAYTNQAAFNSSDNCYYVFKTRMGVGAGYNTLYKISLSGVVTTLTNATPVNCYALTYNRVTNKLYCITVAGTVSALAEITITGSAYTTTNLTTGVHTPYANNTTVDDNSGAVYFTTGDTTTSYIEKYTPGGSTSSVVATVSGAWAVLGLSYNKSDNMLYAVKMLHYPTGTHYDDFLKIDPSTGTVATLSALTFEVNPEFYTACVDPCNSRYIISTLGGTTWMSCYLNQLDLTGALVQHDTTAGFIQGLSVNY
jgi:hypothetical protein